MAAASACAPKTVPAPLVVATPKFPDFLTPAVPPALVGSRAAQNQERGWRFLQAGDFENAKRELALALETAPAFYPADAALGYVELARKDATAALPHFDRALERQADYTSALAGRGQALIALDREAEALAAFEALLAADPSLGDIQRRVEVLRFRGVEQNLAAARQAARSGRLDDAVRGYMTAIASSPDSAFLYRELALIERQMGDRDRALEHLGKAVALDSSDASSLAQIGELLEARGDLEGALSAYTSALAIEPSRGVEARRDALVASAERARLPEEYRAIDSAPEITRADLAALIGVKLDPLLQAAQLPDAVLITDVGTSWAVTWIMAVARAGVMDPYDNHAFEPQTLVRRVDLARAVSGLLAKIGATRPAQARVWETARVVFPDLATTHLAYQAASAAVASGAMKAGSDGSFQPSRPVTGSEASEAIDRLQALADLPSGGTGPRR
jgi:tetratricopeptide (TPR) repeat protein